MEPMSTILAFVAALTALGVAVVVAWFAVSARRASDRRVTRALAAMGGRMDELAHELARTVTAVRDDAERARLVDSLRQAHDVEAVLARCVAAANSIGGVDAARVDVEIDGTPSAAAAGLEGIGVGAILRSPSPAGGSSVRAVGLSYHYEAEHETGRVMRSAVAVPVASSGGVVGFLTVFGRGEDPPVAGSGFQTLEVVAAHTAEAIDRLRGSGTHSRFSQDDRLTGLGNRELCHRTLAAEVARAHRDAGRLAISILDIDDFRQANARIGQIACDGLLVEVADLVRESIRPNDLACRSGGDEFTLILRDARRIDAEALFVRIQAALRRRPFLAGSGLSLSAGIAELKPDDDGVSLFERAERALHRAKQAGKGTAA